MAKLNKLKHNLSNVYNYAKVINSHTENIGTFIDQI